MRAIQLVLRTFSMLLPAVLLAQSAGAVVIFSEGMQTPETISLAPADFGSFGGSYLVPDFSDPSPKNNNARTVWAVSQGVPPTVFSSGFPDEVVSGLFLPSTPEWGANKGRFLTAGLAFNALGGLDGFLYTYDSTGARQPLLLDNYPNAPFNQVLLAPSDFGTIGGSLVLSEVETNFSRIDVLPPGGVLQDGFADTDKIKQGFGLAFAPGGFAGAGVTLLLSDAFSGNIVAIDGKGVVSPFTTLPLNTGQRGLRQMLFAPAGFLIDLGIPGDVLLVSVAGSTFGGGTLGDVLAVDSTGAVVASLRVIDDIDKFDPRGMAFAPTGELLVSDASDPIISAAAADFRSGRFANANAPEPSTLLLFAAGLAGFLAARQARTAPGPRQT